MRVENCWTEFCQGKTGQLHFLLYKKVFVLITANKSALVFFLLISKSGLVFSEVFYDIPDEAPHFPFT